MCIECYSFCVCNKSWLKMCHWWWNYTEHDFILLWLLVVGRNIFCVYPYTQFVVVCQSKSINIFSLWYIFSVDTEFMAENSVDDFHFNSLPLYPTIFRNFAIRFASIRRWYSCHYPPIAQKWVLIFFYSCDWALWLLCFLCLTTVTMLLSLGNF